MKAMVEGVWRTDVEPTRAYRAAAERLRFRAWVRADGASDFAPEPGRYHLYVSYACPFAHRALLGRALLGLEEAVSVSVLDPDWGGPMGWVFGTPPTATPDYINGLASLPEVYRKANARFTGRVTVPALWDKRRGTMVNDEIGRDPAHVRGRVPRARHHPARSVPRRAACRDRRGQRRGRAARQQRGLSRQGFASTQEAYDAAVRDLFAALDDLEARLATRRFLIGERLTEADLRLFPTLIRFDVAYYGALRCNLKRLADYPHLLAYTKRILRISGVATTVKLDHVKRHYWDDHEMINRRIVPIGPTVEFEEQTAGRAA